MAAWQFDVLLVRLTSMTLVPNEHALIPGDLAQLALNRLGERLGKPDLMLPQWRLYGRQDGNRIDVNLDEHGQAEISARLDARIEDVPVQCAVCELAQRIDGALHCADSGTTFEPNVEALSEALHGSRAAEFVLDPNAFLRDLPAPVNRRTAH